MLEDEGVATFEESTSVKSDDDVDNEEEEEDDDDDVMHSSSKPVIVDINAPTQRDLDLLRKHRRSISQGHRPKSTVPQEPELEAALRAKVMQKLDRIISSKNIAKTMSAEKSDDNKFIVQHQSSLAMVKTQSKAALLKISAKDLQEVERRRRQQQLVQAGGTALSPSSREGSKRGVSPSARSVSPGLMSSSSFRLHSPAKSTVSPRGAHSSSHSSFHRHGIPIDDGYFFYSANRVEREQEDMKKIAKHVRQLKPLATAQRQKEHLAEQWLELQKFTPVSRQVRLLGIVKESSHHQKVEKAGLEALENRTTQLLQSLRIKNHQLSVDDVIEAKVQEAARLQEAQQHMLLSRSELHASSRNAKSSSSKGLAVAKGGPLELSAIFEKSTIFEKSAMLQSLRVGGGFRNHGGGDVSPRVNHGGGFSPRRDHTAVAILDAPNLAPPAGGVVGSHVTPEPRSLLCTPAPSSSFNNAQPNPLSLSALSQAHGGAASSHDSSSPLVQTSPLLDNTELRAVLLFSMLVYTLVVVEVRLEGSVLQLLREEPTVPRNVCVMWLQLLATVLPGLFSASTPSRGDDSSFVFPDQVDLASWVLVVVAGSPRLASIRSQWKAKEARAAIGLALLPAAAQRYGLCSVPERVWRSTVLDAFAPHQQLQPAQRAVAATCRLLLGLKLVPGMNCPGQLAARSWCLALPTASELMSTLGDRPSLGISKSITDSTESDLHADAANQRKRFVAYLYNTYLRMCQGLCCCPRCHIVSGTDSSTSTARQLSFDEPRIALQAAASGTSSQPAVSRGLTVEQFTACGFLTHGQVAEDMQPNRHFLCADSPGSRVTPSLRSPEAHVLSPAYTLTTDSSPTDGPLGTARSGIGELQLPVALLPPTRKQLLSAIRVAFFSYDEDEDGALSFFEVAKMLLTAARDVVKASLTRPTATSLSIMKDQEGPNPPPPPPAAATSSSTTAATFIAQHLALQLGITGDGTTSCADRSSRRKLVALEDVVSYLTVDCHVLGLSLVS